MIFLNYLNLKSVSEESSLVYLYTTLIKLDEKQCEEFLDSIKIRLLSTDAIVHIFNAISPKKDKIKNWKIFVELATQKLILTEGEEVTNDLLKVIL